MAASGVNEEELASAPTVFSPSGWSGSSRGSPARTATIAVVARTDHPRGVLRGAENDPQRLSRGVGPPGRECAASVGGRRGGRLAASAGRGCLQRASSHRAPESNEVDDHVDPPQDDEPGWDGAELSSVVRAATVSRPPRLPLRPVGCGDGGRSRSRPEARRLATDGLSQRRTIRRRAGPERLRDATDADKRTTFLAAAHRHHRPGPWRACGVRPC